MKIVNVCFSPNGETRRIADYFTNQLNVEIHDLTLKPTRDKFNDFSGDFLILSLPVYSQNIPVPIRDILPKFKFRFAIINLTYGGYTYGNVLREIGKSIDSTIIGYSVSSTKHSYIGNEAMLDYSSFEPLIQRLKNQITEHVNVPKRVKIYPSFLERWLTDITYRLSFNPDLCTKCGLCKSNCPTDSISPNIEFPKTCIKCAKCVNICPTGAIQGKKSLFVQLYFLKKKRTGVIIR